jgi:hypothetical protein
MRGFRRVGLAALVLLLPGLARAQPSLALRAGYAVPRGAAANLGGLGAFDQGDLFGRLLPIQLDASWRFSPRLSAGIFLSYGTAGHGRQLRTLLCNSFSCSSVTDTRLGVQAAWSFGPRGPVEPWVGFGAGIEEARFTARNVTFATGQPPPGPAYLTDDIRTTFRGWAVHADVGADWRFRSDALVGPYAQLMVGQYRVQDIRFGPPGTVPGNGGIPSTNPHEFVAVGVRARYEL